MRVAASFVCLLLILWSSAPAADDEITRALSQRQFDVALKAIDGSLKTQPANARLWTLRGAALHGLGRDQESLVSYRKAVKLQPNLMPALQAVAQLEYSIKDPNARRTLAKILALEPNNQVAHAMMAVLAFEAKDCDAVVNHFAKAGEQVSRQKEALGEQGFCLYQLSRPAAAAVAFQRLLSLDETDSKARLNLVLSLAAADRPREAIEVLRPLADSVVPEADVLGLLAELYRANQQIDEAVAAFRRGIDLYPREERLYIGLAALCSYYNSYDLGLEIANIGLRNIPNSTRLYAMRGVLYSQMGQRDNSMSDFERASQLSPQEGVGQTGVALSLLQADRIDESIQFVREQLQKNPDDANGYYILAQALLRKGAQPGDAMFAEVQTSLEKCVRIAPRFDQGHGLLGKVYSQLNKTQLAIKELETALKLQPDNRVAIYQLMLAYETTGRDKDAATMQERLRATIEKERKEENEKNKIRLLKNPSDK